MNGAADTASSTSRLCGIRSSSYGRHMAHVFKGTYRNKSQGIEQVICTWCMKVKP